MTKNQLEQYRKKLSELSEKEKELRDSYLMKFYDDSIQGPLTGISSIDKPWFSRKQKNINMPDPNQSAYNFMRNCNEGHMDDIALIYDPILDEEPTKITYGELIKRIDETAKAYIAYGVKKGDIVTVSLPSFVEDIVNFYALNKIGAVANQIHPLASQDEIEFYLNEAESKIFVGYGDVYEKIKKIKCGTLEHVILVSPKDSISSKVKMSILKKTISKDVIAGIKMLGAKEEKYEGTICVLWKDFIKKGKDIEDISEYENKDANSLATLSHTSGTSGKSKAVMTTSKAFNESVISILRGTDIFQRGDKDLLVLPPFPLYILNNGVHLSLCVGEQLIVIPKVEYDKLSLYFKKHDPQHIKGIPSTAESMLKDKGFDGLDLSNFKLLISGGGKLSCEDEINEFLRAHNCPNDIANGYGMSEGGGAITCMFNDTKEKGTVGRPLMKCMAKAVSLETGEELSYLDDENGEIYLTGPAVMEGYYKNEVATEELFCRDEDGTIWLKTGDLGKITKEGNVKVVGRLKRTTFVFDAENNTASKVSHDYMETILCQNVGVEDAVVVAVPDEKSRHAFKAYITLREKAYDDVIKELDKLCKVTFREYISPIEYVVIDNIPKNAAGKNDYKYIESYEENPEKEKDKKVKVLYRKEISER